MHYKKVLSQDYDPEHLFDYSDYSDQDYQLETTIFAQKTFRKQIDSLEQNKVLQHSLHNFQWEESK